MYGIAEKAGRTRQNRGHHKVVTRTYDGLTRLYSRKLVDRNVEHQDDTSAPSAAAAALAAAAVAITTATSEGAALAGGAVCWVHYVG